jgi:hypothetical protein
MPPKKTLPKRLKTSRRRLRRSGRDAARARRATTTRCPPSRRTPRALTTTRAVLAGVGSAAPATSRQPARTLTRSLRRPDRPTARDAAESATGDANTAGRTIAADLAEAISARTPATVLDRVTGLIAKAHTKAAAGASSRRPFTAPAGKKRTRYFPKGGQRQSAEPPPHLAADADGPGAGADQVISVSTPCSGDKELKNTMCQVMCNGGPQHRERKRQRPGTVNGWKPSTVLTRLSSAQAAGTPRARRVLGAGPGASQSWRSGDAASSHTHIKSTKR